MSWSVRLAPALLGPEYDGFRDQIAAVEGPGGTVGHLVTYAEEVEKLCGFCGLRPKLRLTERFMGWFMPKDGRADEEHLDLAEIEAGVIWGNCRLRWLEGAERERAWQSYLEKWGPHQPSRVVGKPDEDSPRSETS